MDGVESTRILIANELTSYREAVAMILRETCPNIEVFETEAENLDREVGRLSPSMVVCSEATKLVRARTPIWIELYPRCAFYSVASVCGKLSTFDDMQLSDILSVADCATGLAK